MLHCVDFRPRYSLQILRDVIVTTLDLERLMYSKQVEKKFTQRGDCLAAASFLIVCCFLLILSAYRRLVARCVSPEPLCLSGVFCCFVMSHDMACFALLSATGTENRCIRRHWRIARHVSSLWKTAFLRWSVLLPLYCSL